MGGGGGEGSGGAEGCGASGAVAGPGTKSFSAPCAADRVAEAAPCWIPMSTGAAPASMMAWWREGCAARLRKALAASNFIPQLLSAHRRMSGSRPDAATMAEAVSPFIARDASSPAACSCVSALSELRSATSGGTAPAARTSDRFSSLPRHRALKAAAASSCNSSWLSFPSSATSGGIAPAAAIADE